MASKRNTSLALFLSLNLIFFSLVSAWTPRSPQPMTPPSPQPGTPPGPQPGTPPGPQPSTPPSPQPGNSCPRDALRLGVCLDVLGSLVNVTIGDPPVTPCCSLIEGLADLEAAVCLCTVIRANILGININLPIYLSLLLNVCSRNVPRDFVCA